MTGSLAINRVKLAPGLYFLATPIGAARDITLRALDILACAEVLYAEDTRSLRKLMEIHGINLEGRKVFSYHDHSSEGDRARILQHLSDGASVAYASEAGTPLIADPGFQLGRAAIDAGHSVIAAPGPSAVLAALTVSGLGTDRFFFAGFAPNASSARRRFLAELADVSATLVLYESPRRVHGLLEDLVAECGAAREVVVARELTKKFEEVLRGTASELAAQLAERSLKGEVVVMVSRPVAGGASGQNEEETMRTELEMALEGMSLKDAVAAVSAALDIPRRKVYQAALDLKK